jgi:hypothetical protein
MAAGLKQAPPRRLSSKLCASRQARSALRADGASPDPFFVSELYDTIGAATATAPVAVDLKRAAFQADDRLPRCAQLMPARLVRRRYGRCEAL